MYFPFRNIIFVIIAVQFTAAVNNNVCPTIDDYETIDTNPKCNYNPDISGNITEMVTNHGFNIESHTVTTWDGYILEIFRIPSSVNDTCDNSKPKQPMLFVHGINRDARCWLLMGSQSPALYYASKCYDVWVANTRGSIYSKHQTYSSYSKDFWDFSFHETATIDIPAIVDTIANVTDQAGKIIYVGHSMGTTISYIYGSVNATHCKNNVKAIISLAPVAYLDKIKVPFIRLIALNGHLIMDTLYFVKLYWLQLQPILSFCTGFPFINACDYFAQIIFGKCKPNIYPQTLPVLTANGSAPISVKTLMHYSQIITRFGRFAWYDYGIVENLSRYKSIFPPLYDVGKIEVNVDLIYANDDLFAVKDDVMVLYNNLQDDLKSIAEVPKDLSQYMNHLDFLISANMNEIYDIIDSKLKNYTN